MTMPNLGLEFGWVGSTTREPNHQNQALFAAIIFFDKGNIVLHSGSTTT
jgi:hypothetical protein